MKVKLSALVGQFLDSINASSHEYARAYRIGIRGFEALELDVTGKATTVKMKVNGDNTSNLPSDYISLLDIGPLNDEGEIKSLTRNDRLSKESGEEPFEEDWYLYDVNVDMVGSDAGSLGVGSHVSIGEYSVDSEAGLVYYNPEFPYDCVHIKYLARQKVDGEYLVDVRASEALVAYITWKWHSSLKGVGPTDKAMYRREWFNEKRLAKLRMRRLTNANKNQLSRQSVKQGLKG